MSWLNYFVLAVGAIAKAAALQRAAEVPADSLASASSTCEKCTVKWQNDRGRLLFVGVFSSAKYKHRRDEVRNSWMQDQMLKDPQSPVQAAFILGMPDSYMPELLEEQQEYQDIIFLPVRDAYDNLPGKSLAFFKWFKETQDPTFFAMKLDDDTFPNFNLIVPVLAEVKERSPTSYIGGLQWHGPVQKEGKWAEVESYQGTTYPAYAAGSGYILSNALIGQMQDLEAEEPGRIKILRNEDTTIGNFIHQENWLSMNVEYVNLEHDVWGCHNGAALAMNLWPGELRCMWEKRLNGTTSGEDHKDDNCCRPLENYGLWEEGQDKPEPSLLSVRRLPATTRQFLRQGLH